LPVHGNQGFGPPPAPSPACNQLAWRTLDYSWRRAAGYDFGAEKVSGFCFPWLARGCMAAQSAGDRPAWRELAPAAGVFVLVLLEVAAVGRGEAFSLQLPEFRVLTGAGGQAVSNLLACFLAVVQSG
jgi:hypothetical protein